MDDRITIIEGPPPVFEEVHEGWVLGLNESPSLGNIAVTRLRTLNGPALVERCYRAWHNQKIINLEYRAYDGLEKKSPIVAAKHLDVDEGQMLILWVRLAEDDVELELGYEDDASTNEDDDLSPQ